MITRNFNGENADISPDALCGLALLYVGLDNEVATQTICPYKRQRPGPADIGDTEVADGVGALAQNLGGNKDHQLIGQI